MNISPEFARKLLQDTLKVKGLNLAQGWWSWITDSTYRISKRLDKTLSDQLIDPATALRSESVKYDTDPDDCIIGILNDVVRNFKYVSDDQQFKKLEYWSSAEETLTSKEGDCEDLNSYIYIMARLAGIPQYLLWSVIGDTVYGLHYWLLYLSPKTGKVYVIDAAMSPDLEPISIRDEFTMQSPYTSIRYLFNEENIFKQR